MTVAITEAVLSELAEVGFGQLSMDGVARRARAGKSALYRRWPSKQEMVLDAVSSVSVPIADVRTSHDLRTVVTLLVESVDNWLSDDMNRRILPDLLAEALRNPDLGEALTTRIGLIRRTHYRRVLEERISTGEVDADADIEYALDLLAGPLFWRVCGRRQSSSPALRENVVQSVLDVLRGATR
ncbi:DNA-binding transcriptional regulator, AcrR family [Actinomadura madurae]|uniref:DNA-binding transcriptional regulator, AcrR family n=1 Tax=Actinomadura madurae TaxID=1993 RepID=A0A1I5SBG7_9ACTN|nr:DNA-binding transcriptional regulator, AcrR family [Actinomadura madurae]SPT64127.1 Bacterial regulatory proteins, tetR family [Actinomadura madurae]